MRKFVVATGNAHKVGEIQAILSDYAVELLSLKDFPSYPTPVEDGETYTDNALIKARYFAERLGQPCLADDSGLEVDSLDGQPGVHSARFAGAETPHSQKIVELLEMLQGKRDRQARFHCSAVLVEPSGDETVVEAVFEGSIAEAPSGEGGFGYDPVFVVGGRSITAAQLSEEEKNQISHRAQAFRGLMDKLGVPVDG